MNLAFAQNDAMKKELEEKEASAAAAGGGFVNTDLTISIGKCFLKPLKNDRAQFYQLFFGYIQGLYDSKNYPKDTSCEKCKQFAKPWANMQQGIALILGLAGDLFSNDSFSKMGASKRMKKLYVAYQFFWKFVINLDALYNSDVAKALWAQLINTLSEEYAGMLRNNLWSNIWAMLGIVSTIQDSNCREFGVKIGALLRKLFKYEFV